MASASRMAAPGAISCAASHAAVAPAAIAAVARRPAWCMRASKQPRRSASTAGGGVCSSGKQGGSGAGSCVGAPPGAQAWKVGMRGAGAASPSADVCDGVTPAVPGVGSGASGRGGRTIPGAHSLSETAASGSCGDTMNGRHKRPRSRCRRNRLPLPHRSAATATQPTATGHTKSPLP
eukprot:353916-Chlamydomonas_euryale.AAC.6